MCKNTFGTKYKNFEDRINRMINSIDKRRKKRVRRTTRSKRLVKVVLRSTNTNFNLKLVK